MKVQHFNYEILKVYSLDSLNQFKEHHRLQVFFHKGCKCVSCGREGTQLIKAADAAGGIHWDVYDRELVPLTVDHILPRSKGGKNHIDNYQPMCTICNGIKGNGEPKVLTLNVGDPVVSRKDNKYIGTLMEFTKTPEGNRGFRIKENPKLIFNRKKYRKALDNDPI